ncbi:putative pre-16S rRNA nuclease [Tanacetum coccineum]
MKHMESMPLNVNLVKQQQFTLKPLRLFALHVGVNQVSLAVSELISKPASPYCVMVRRGNNILDRIQELIRQESVAALIVGLPSNAGKRHPGNNPDATEVGVFLDELSQTGKLEGVEYTLWNDQCTAKKGVECLVDPLPLDLPIAAAAARKIRGRVFLTCATDMLQIYHMDLESTMRLIALRLDVIPRNMIKSGGIKDSHGNLEFIIKHFHHSSS